MMIGGKLRSVVLYHSTRPVEAQRPINRSIQNIDTKFDTERKEAAFVASLMRGEIDLLPDLGWYAISKNRYSSASALRNHQDRMITMMTPYSTDDGCSCRCCGGRVDHLDLRGEGVVEALERIRRIVHVSDEDDDDDDDDGDNGDDGDDEVEEGGKTGDDDAIRLLDGTLAPINKHGVPIALGVRVSTYWSGAPVSGIITLATKDVCEVAYHPQNGLCRFVYEHEFNELHPSEETKAKHIIYDPSLPMSFLVQLFTCEDCVSSLELGLDDLLSKPCRRCMCATRLGELAYCAPCGEYTCSGFIDPDSRERTFVCTGKGERSDGVALDSSNTHPSSKRSICDNCERECSNRQGTKRRRDGGARTNDSSRGSVEYHRKLWRAVDRLRNKSGTNIPWAKVAETLGDDDKEKTRYACKNTWVARSGRKKCGECPRCTAGTQCVIDLKTFERFLKTKVGRNAKFGRDAISAATGKHKKSN